MKLEVNKKYMTRDGREAKVVYILEESIDSYRETAVTILDGKIYTHSIDGKFLLGTEIYLDLIEPITLNFKDWLASNGINTELFWKNCKEKHNGFHYKRKELVNSFDENWIGMAFDWDGNLLGKTEKEMEDLHIAWGDLVRSGEYINIEFGFGKKDK